MPRPIVTVKLGSTKSKILELAGVENKKELPRLCVEDYKKLSRHKLAEFTTITVPAEWFTYSMKATISAKMLANFDGKGSFVNCFQIITYVRETKTVVSLFFEHYFNKDELVELHVIYYRKED